MAIKFSLVLRKTDKAVLSGWAINKAQAKTLARSYVTSYNKAAKEAGKDKVKKTDLRLVFLKQV